MRIGCGAGFAGDRLDGAHQLVEAGDLDYLVLECLAERTIALRQLERRWDEGRGFDPLLVRRVGPLLHGALERGTRIITNAGAANPLAGGRAVLHHAEELDLSGVEVAVVTGDEVLQAIDPDAPALEDVRRCPRTARSCPPTPTWVRTRCAPP